MAIDTRPGRGATLVVSQDEDARGTTHFLILILDGVLAQGGTTREIRALFANLD